MVGPTPRSFRYYAALLAEGLEQAGRIADVLEVIHPALATVVEPGVGIFVSELYRLQGVPVAFGRRRRTSDGLSLRTARSRKRSCGCFGSISVMCFDSQIGIRRP